MDKLLENDKNVLIFFLNGVNLKRNIFLLFKMGIRRYNGCFFF